MKRRSIFPLVAAAAISGSRGLFADSRQDTHPSPQDHIAWVSEVLLRMQTIQPGMTRDALLRVFTTEGGISTASTRRYISRECPYFKVDIEFQIVGRPERDDSGRLITVEGGRDIISKISKPFLEFSMMD